MTETAVDTRTVLCLLLWVLFDRCCGEVFCAHPPLVANAVSTLFLRDALASKKKALGGTSRP